MSTRDLPTIIFLHIPKTGGTSFYSILSTTFGKDSVFVPLSIETENAKSIATLTDDQKASIRVVAGHMPYGAHKFFKASEYVTILRDPTAAVLSSWFHVNSDPRIPGHSLIANGQVGLPEFARFFSNMFTRRLLRYDFLDPCLWLTTPLSTVLEVQSLFDLQFKDLGPEQFEQAFDVLRSFAVIGTTERYGEFLKAFADRYGLGQVAQMSSIQLNKNLQDNYHYQVDAETRAMIRELNEYDYALYELASAASARA